MHPIAILAAVGAAGAGVFAFMQQKKNAPTPAPGTPPVTPGGNQTTPVTTNMLSEAQKAAANYLGTSPPPGYPTFSDFLQKGSPQQVQAHALYDYLKAHGVDGSAKQAELTMAFQKAHNANKIGTGMGGQLPETGVYDAITSAALTMYTGDPIPGSANDLRTPTLGEVLTGKKIGENGTTSGTAMSSGFNVKQWLIKNGHTDLSNPTLVALVAQFQGDMNTDPIFPGPSYAPSPKPPITFKQVGVDGNLGPQGSETRKALKYLTDPTGPNGEAALYAWL